MKKRWEEVNVDIDFSKHEPTSVRGSLHIYEEIYEIDGSVYRKRCAVDNGSEPEVEIQVPYP